jgi:hypothetical protein
VQSYGRRFRLAIVLQYCNDAATLTATRAFTLSSVELKIPSVSPSTGCHQYPPSRVIRTTLRPPSCTTTWVDQARIDLTVSVQWSGPSETPFHPQQTAISGSMLMGNRYNGPCLLNRLDNSCSSAFRVVPSRCNRCDTRCSTSRPCLSLTDTTMLVHVTNASLRALCYPELPCRHGLRSPSA